MPYPWWDVPFLTAPMLIAVVAVLHVLVSHYAVGGGAFLALETQYASAVRHKAYLAYLRGHAWFFILLTVVFGAISGVGIWWTIGLASPLATEVLIRTFVFGWAMEYVFFVLEIVAAFVFFYFWDRLDRRTHVTIGWIYAGAAWASLVLITAITGFMLHPGAWLQQPSFWRGFFNPQFVPQVLARTGGAFLLAALYVYLHASVKVRDPALRDLIARRSARPALLGAVLIVVGGLAWYAFLPESAQAALPAAAALNVLVVLLFALTLAVFAMLYLGPYRHPGWLSPGFALLLFVCGLAAFATGEFVREAVRKPYIVYNVVLGNQVRVADVARVRARGVLESGTWTRAFVAARYPQLMAGETIDETRFASLPADDQRELGRVLFAYQCNNCHAARDGYSALGHFTRGWSFGLIRTMLDHLDESTFFMPPWIGTPEEADVLARYLASIAYPRPGGMAAGR